MEVILPLISKGSKQVQLVTTQDLIFEKLSKENSALVSAAVGLKAAIATAAGTALIGSVLTGAGSSSIILLIKLFQILDILANLSKINVEFSHGVQIIFDLIDSLRIPVIPFLYKLSPITEQDVLLFPRGTRGKLTNESNDVFIIYGQIMVCCFLIIFACVAEYFL